MTKYSRVVDHNTKFRDIGRRDAGMQFYQHLPEYKQALGIVSLSGALLFLKQAVAAHADQSCRYYSGWWRNEKRAYREAYRSEMLLLIKEYKGEI